MPQRNDPIRLEGKSGILELLSDTPLYRTYSESIKYQWLLKVSLGDHMEIQWMSNVPNSLELKVNINYRELYFFSDF